MLPRCSTYLPTLVVCMTVICTNSTLVGVVFLLLLLQLWYCVAVLGYIYIYISIEIERDTYRNRNSPLLRLVRQVLTESFGGKYPQPHENILVCPHAYPCGAHGLLFVCRCVDWERAQCICRTTDHVVSS